MKRCIVTPSGHRVGLNAYVDAWRRLKTVPADTEVSGWDWFARPASEILDAISSGVHSRINRHLPWSTETRKWDWQWQADMARAARDLNTPRLCIHWLPPELRARFANRITRDL